MREGNKVLYDYSRVSAWLKCRRLYYLRYVRDLAPKQISTSLSFGKVMHSALAVWYRTKDAIAALAEWDKYEDRDYDPKRTQDRGREILQNYILRWGKEEPFEILAVEIPFELPLGSTWFPWRPEAAHDLYLIGKIDMLVRYPGGLCYVWDHKTTSSLGDTFFYSFKPDMQMSGYCLAGRELFGSVQGIVINAISTAKTAGKGARDFDRHISPRSKEDLEEYRQAMLSHMREICLTEERASLVQDPVDLFTPNFDQCYGRYGSCAFRDACLSHLDESLIQENFEVKQWDPREEEEER